MANKDISELEFEKIKSEMIKIIDAIKNNENKMNKAIKYMIQGIYYDFRISQVPDKKLLSEFYYSVGMGYQLLSGKENKKKALEFLPQAEKIIEELQDEARLFDVYNEIGISYYMLEKYHQANLFYEKALKLANDQVLGGYNVSLALLNLSTINTINGEYITSIQQLNEARNLMDNSSSNLSETKIQKRFGLIYYNLAINYLYINEIEKSVEFYRLANQHSKFNKSYKEIIIREIDFITKDIDDIDLHKIDRIKSEIRSFD